ncbi:MAG: ThuA domain-containing protein [Armatimonadetes bacterium]|nr:ThuA domain-containing protein [Armatimonadota bacterium]
MLTTIAAVTLACAQDDPPLVYTGRSGLAKGKRIVLLAGDEEYRSEEALPQLAKILANRFGATCTVLFSIGKDGTIDPDRHGHQPGLEALDRADACVMLLRFREWPDEQMKHFVDYLRRGKPIVALRTSTHAFDYADGSTSAYKRFGWKSKEWPGGFGGQVLGENWVSHWGDHGRQATLGLPEPGKSSHPVLKGVTSVFGDTDVYEARPPSDAEVLLRGQVLSGMDRTDPPAKGRKKDASGQERDLNSPMMPVAWIRNVANEWGTSNRVIVTTMGAATDLQDEGFRRFSVNAVFWALGLDRKLTGKEDVGTVGDYRPSRFGFGGYVKGIRPRDLKP